MANIETDILEAMPDAVMLTDKSGQEVFWLNLAAQNLFRQSSKSVFGRQLSNLDPGLQELVFKLKKHDGNLVVRGKLTLYLQSAPDDLFDYCIFPLNSENPLSNDRLVIVLSRPHLANNSDAQLQSVSMLGRMLAHEIKNPLSGIDGAAQILDTILDNKSDKELTALIRSEVARVKRLADEMESFGEKKIKDWQMFNIHEVLRKSLLLVKSSNDCGLEFVENYDPSLPEIYGSPDRLSQLFINLIDNAKSAIINTGFGNKIEIKTQWRSGVSVKCPNGSSCKLPVEIMIIDNGPGIEPGIMDKIFQPFITNKPNGQGLGLALVSKIINEHCGLIEFSSRKSFTVFSVLLPDQNPNRDQKEAG